MTVHFSDSDFQVSPSTETSETSANITLFERRRFAQSWQNEVVSTLCRFVELPENWDSYGGKPLRHDTGMFALQLINAVMGPSLPSPYILPVADGGVQIEWHMNALDIELYVSAPYESELVVEDHISGERRTYFLKSDYTPLKDALKKLVDFNRANPTVAHAG
jgi:hypothetical protein